MAGYQRTIKKEVSIGGIGLHTGLDCTATFKPADINTGIRFARTDLDNFQPIIADRLKVIQIGFTPGIPRLTTRTGCGNKG